MKKAIKTLTLVLTSILVSSLAFADVNPRDAVGTWNNIDDSTGEKKARVVIAEKEGKLYGTIVEIYKKENKDKLCTACTDDRKDKPVAGLEIIRSAKKVSGDWEWKGKILDPENGKEYRLKMWTSKDGKKLSVRGYLGMFYRTQYWQRVEVAQPEPQKANPTEAK